MERVPGQADSAPHGFDPKKIVVSALILSIVTFGLFYANYINGWVTPDLLGGLGERPG